MLTLKHGAFGDSHGTSFLLPDLHGHGQRFIKPFVFRHTGLLVLIHHEGCGPWVESSWTEQGDTLSGSSRIIQVLSSRTLLGTESAGYIEYSQESGLSAGT